MVKDLLIQIKYKLMTKTGKVLLFVGFVLMTIGLAFFLIPYLVTQTSFGWTYTTETGAVGDTIGGIAGTIVGFIGVILTFFAFYIQYQANQVQINALNEQKDSAREQKKQELLRQFESNFFELVKIHRENVSELNYTKFENGDLRTSKHRKVFRMIFSEFVECFREVKAFSNSKNPSDYLKDIYKEKLIKIKEKNNLNIDIIELAIIDISYSIVFYGIGEESEFILRDKFKRRYNDKYFYPLLQYVKLKPKRVTCPRKITPSGRRESTKIKIGDSSYEKDIYRRADRWDSAWI